MYTESTSAPPSHQGPVDNRATFDRLFDALESGVSIGIFPEGVSHAASQMTRLKTGAARIAWRRRPPTRATAATPAVRSPMPTNDGMSRPTIGAGGTAFANGRRVLPPCTVPTALRRRSLTLRALAKGVRAERSESCRCLNTPLRAMTGRRSATAAYLSFHVIFSTP